MSSLRTLRLHSDYVVRVGPPLSPTPQIVRRVREIWEEEQDGKGRRLRNDTVYVLSEYNTDCLLIQPAEYSYVVARRLAPDLDQAGLLIRPLAVTGVLICAGGLVLGRRSADVAYDSELWEPAPAGGLRQPDPVAQILEELREELGIESSRVAAPEPCGLIEDIDSGVVDIVFRLDAALESAEDIQATYREFGSKEYSELAIVDGSALTGFLEANQTRVLPALRSILRLARVM